MGAIGENFKIEPPIAVSFDVLPDFPWRQDRFLHYGVFRHNDNGKWFSLIMNVKWDVLLKNNDTDTIDIINLKTDPVRSDERCKDPGIYPGYHMNRKNWISVVLNDTLPDKKIMSLVSDSFELTKK